MPPSKLIKIKSEKCIDTKLALEIFVISPYITFQHIQGKDNTLADSLCCLHCLGLYESIPPEKPGEEFGITIFDEGETIHEHAQPEDFASPHPDVVTLISDPSIKESAIDKHTFQVGDDLYEKNLPTPHI